MRPTILSMLALGLAVLACGRVAIEQPAEEAREPAALTQPERAERGGSSDIDSDRPPRAAPAPPANPEPEPSYYRYVDAGGSMHFVSSLDQVPASYRDQATPTGFSGGGLTRVQSAARPSGAPRPFAYDPDTAAGHRSADVVVYTAPWCGWCRKTMGWLDSRGVPYDNRDIEADPGYRAELIEKSGGTSIPFVEIGEGQIRGHSPERMSRLLAGS
ncbi:MAG: hypothetical protein CL910_04370 [Deltaproteobacteria bacterium]|jgi:glutaredoxin 3|nr:hypothetical protein [Deltaproteobacteria bacterium]